MKFIIILALFGLVPAGLLAGPSRDLKSTDILAAWLKFRYQHGKFYRSAEEEQKRMSIFAQNFRRIQEHQNNLAGFDYERGVNYLSDRTTEEVRKLNGLKISKEMLNSIEREPLEMMGQADNIPEEVDWSKHPERVGPVKSQLYCGSCWAFATTGLVEGQEAIHGESAPGKITMLSEQQLIDCDDKDDGCNGGNPMNSLEYIGQVHGLERETSYPYESEEGDDNFECRFNSSKVVNSTRTIRKGKVLKQSEKVLKNYVATYGPVLVGIDASLSSFRDYKSGVYYDPDCSSGDLDHAVLVVGYGHDKVGGDYWLVKNSWGEEWGMKGYIKIARNRDNHCGIVTMAMIAV